MRLVLVFALLSCGCGGEQHDLDASLSDASTDSPKDARVDAYCTITTCDGSATCQLGDFCPRGDGCNVCWCDWRPDGTKLVSCSMRNCDCNYFPSDGGGQ